MLPSSRWTSARHSILSVTMHSRQSFPSMMSQTPSTTLSCFLKDRSHVTRFVGQTSYSVIAYINAIVVQGSGFGPSSFDIVAFDLHPLHKLNACQYYNRPTVYRCEKSSYRLLRLFLVQLFRSIFGDCPTVVSQDFCGPCSLVFLFHICDFVMKTFAMFFTNQITVSEGNEASGSLETHCNQVSDTASACLLLVPRGFLS